MKKASRTFQYGEHQLTLETGRIARQAKGSVLVRMGNTVVLAAVTVGEPREGINFMPLTVHYQERFYASGRIPGSFFRREGRPSEKETLVSRLIDRPLRPLFPKGFARETLVMCTVMSAELDELDPDIPAMIGASAALALSGVPFHGPIAAARVGLDAEGNYLLNPGGTVLGESYLDMVIAGSEDAVLMVESQAEELSEERMLDAVMYGHREMQTVIREIQALAAEAGVTPDPWEQPEGDPALAEKLRASFAAPIAAAYQITDKPERYARLDELREQAQQELLPGEEQETAPVTDAFGKLEKQLVRERVLSGEPRIDGRDLHTVRPIDIEVGLLPRAHGSALFTRGETQAIGAVTLGTARDAQIIDALDGRQDDYLMLHYNFPPYCVGESGRVGPPGRREIGHGRLARRGLKAVLPSQESFPYTIRVVSEITESNGSSSMATVCIGSLALMDAGVPLRAPVAGVAMGLVKEAERFAVLTDILGDEDHLGDMDFKVAGTADGITALQMDIKIAGIDEQIMRQALTQAREARLHILEEMAKVLSESRPQVADHAPGLEIMHIPVDRIRDVIGKGGATIRALTEETGTGIDVEQDGSVRVYGENRDAIREAMDRIAALTAEVEVGEVYEGEVVRITDFGAFVNILPGKDGLVHISQIAPERVERVTDYLSEGQRVRTKVIQVDETGRIKLSIKELANH